MKTSPKKIALIIVDLQNDFLSPDGAYARGGAASAAARELPGRVAGVARALKAGGGLVASSQFTLWPDAQGEPMISPHLLGLRPFLRRGDFAPGSEGQANVAELQPLIDVSVCKVAYSAFFNTQLDWVLRHAGIDTVAVCGIVTNGGVASTVRDAHMREYHTIVLSDGCAAFKPEVHATSLADMGTVAQVMRCEEFIRSLS
ncbi:MAG: isochorismatase family cysteine hydrolase [Polaromonas sp.]|uniref:cysteine hydrolase family protein n=1 Tax=Polaromonas sp. TaxID=1869339 RepID=UPI002731D7F4|nr:isochorismatase family cysteine hydrolase [Polaromonas sp.]MDP2452456.1 isochorismatase family cysteine hydrolase [Polaromonas sp.]MDP3246847.1 isochorismatase family cysteine hydrolase [Polaromonas sp.]MDP3753875.1 isochorismatase family cysteine hydrolase [Polaromonas sp.]MDP3827896.1 isochorismatase family cysteine hydrolase [Polaromonas sp.]